MNCKIVHFESAFFSVERHNLKRCVEQLRSKWVRWASCYYVTDEIGFFLLLLIALKLFIDRKFEQTIERSSGPQSSYAKGSSAAFMAAKKKHKYFGLKSKSLGSYSHISHVQYFRRMEEHLNRLAIVARMISTQLIACQLHALSLKFKRPHRMFIFLHCGLSL